MTTETTALTKTANTGQQIEIRVSVKAGIAQYAAYLDGQPVGTELRRYYAGKLVAGKVAVASIGKVALTKEQWTTVESAGKAAELATPEGQVNRLREERQVIADEIANCRAKATREFERLHSREDARAWTVKTEWESKAEAAVAKLREWDAAHPEIKAQIDAEREIERQRKAEEHERWMRSD